MMLLMMAAELVATGAWEMFWFQALSAGNRFELSSEPRAVAIGIAMAQLKTKPPTNCILHQQAIRKLSHIGGERATRARGLWGLRCRLTVDWSGGAISSKHVTVRPAGNLADHLPHQHVEVGPNGRLGIPIQRVGQSGPAQLAASASHDGDRSGQAPHMPPVMILVHAPAFGVAG